VRAASERLPRFCRSAGDSTVEAMLSEADLDFVDICTPPVSTPTLPLQRAVPGPRFLRKTSGDTPRSDSCLHQAANDSGRVVYNRQQLALLAQWCAFAIDRGNAIGNIESVRFKSCALGFRRGPLRLEETPDLAGEGFCWITAGTTSTCC